MLKCLWPTAAVSSGLVTLDLSEEMTVAALLPYCLLVEFSTAADTKVTLYRRT